MKFNITLRTKLLFSVKFVGGGWERGTEPHNFLEGKHTLLASMQINPGRMYSRKL